MKPMKNLKLPQQTTIGWIAIAIIFMSFTTSPLSKGLFISDTGEGQPHESAVLEVEST